MADNLLLRVTYKPPHWRIRAAMVAIFVLNPFVRNEKTGARIGDALEAFVLRGLQVYVNGKLVS